VQLELAFADLGSMTTL